MSKTGTSVVARINCQLLKPHDIIFGCKTQEFAFECLGSSLHQQSPELVFDRSFNSSWYVGIPMSFLIQAVNVRFQVIKQAVIMVNVTNNGIEVLKASTQSQQEISPQKCINFPFIVSPVKQGELVVRVSLTFIYDNSKSEIVSKFQYRIDPSVNTEIRYISSDSDRLEMTIRNCSPYLMNNVRTSHSSSSEVIIESHLCPDNTISTMLFVPRVTKEIAVLWDLPFSKNCQQIASLLPVQSVLQSPIGVSFLELPQFFECASPIQIKMIISGVQFPIKGRLEIHRANECLLPIGSYEYQISLEKEIDFVTFSLIGLEPGEYKLPPISLHINGLASMKIFPKEGVLVLGFNGNKN